MLTDPRPCDRARARRILDLLQSKLPEEAEAGRRELVKLLSEVPNLDGALLKAVTDAATVARRTSWHAQPPADTLPPVPDTTWSERQDARSRRVLVRWANGRVLVVRESPVRPGSWYMSVDGFPADHGYKGMLSAMAAAEAVADGHPVRGWADGAAAETLTRCQPPETPR